MPPRKKEPTGPVPVEAFKHEDKRVNIPTADSSELVSPDVAEPKHGLRDARIGIWTRSSCGEVRTSRTPKSWLWKRR